MNTNQDSDDVNHGITLMSDRSDDEIRRVSDDVPMEQSLHVEKDKTLENEMVLSSSSPSASEAQAPPASTTKKCTVFWVVVAFAVIVVVGIATGVGVYCGHGNCGRTNEVVDPQMLLVACNFLNQSNIKECQDLTYYSGNAVGYTIPSELGVLTKLTGLSLLTMTGTIPSTLGNLVRLKFLQLGTNLTGTIPSSLGMLTRLNYLTLQTNQLTGTIPSALGNLGQLTNLELSRNHLTGTIPSTLGNLSKLYILSLFNNTELGGTVPLSLCSVSDIYISIRCDSSIVCSCCADEFFCN